MHSCSINVVRVSTAPTKPYAWKTEFDNSLRKNGNELGTKPTVSKENSLKVEPDCKSIVGSDQKKNWRLLIATYCRDGRVKDAVKLIKQIQSQGMKHDREILFTVLKACASPSAAESGRYIHEIIHEIGWESDNALGIAIVHMYGKCGNLEEARKMFNKLDTLNVISWTAVITIHAKIGCSKQAFELFHRMVVAYKKPNKVTFVGLVSACNSPSLLAKGKMVHAYIVYDRIGSDLLLQNAVINMYTKCAYVEQAYTMFSRMKQQDLVSWNSMITAFACYENGREAILFFKSMICNGLEPNGITFVNTLDTVTTLAEGNFIHAHVLKDSNCTFQLNNILQNAILSMYSKCGSLENAYLTFIRVHKKDVISWSSIITAYSQQGHLQIVFQLFQQMKQGGIQPNELTFSSIISACGLVDGKMIHAEIIWRDLEADLIIQNALLNMYSRGGSLKDSERMFNIMPQGELYSWTSLIASYADYGYSKEAMYMWQAIFDSEGSGLKPNEMTFLSILTACAAAGDIEKSKLIHAYLTGSTLECSLVLRNSLINMYGKCGSLKDAHQIFNKITEPDMVSWTTLISVCQEQGCSSCALEIFDKMEKHVKPGATTFSTILCACADMERLALGKLIHSNIRHWGFELNLSVGNSLISMYGKCGSLYDAWQAFDEMDHHNLVSWTAIISATAQHGHGMLAGRLFQEMQQDGLRPNDISFISILSAHSHAGLVDEGCLYFSSMWGEYEILLGVEHYACMVDLLGRAGLLDEAENFIFGMPSSLNAAFWKSLVSTCMIHNDTERARHAAGYVLHLDPENAAAYIMLSNIYATAYKCPLEG